MLRRRLRISALLGASALAACPGSRPNADRAIAYPATRTVDSVDTWHGVRVPDPYRWLEDLGAAEVRAWAAAQTKAARVSLADSAATVVGHAD
jgi:prolyl oligopeptidase